MITQKTLKKNLRYNPDTGEFTRLTSPRNGISVGDVAGSKCRDGYIGIGLLCHKYKGHRLAFLYMTGHIPKSCDHINRDRSDNRWANLRAATVSQNAANAKLPITNTSGCKGVHWHKNSQKWHARIRVKGSRLHLGSFTCKYAAYESYAFASRKYFGEFSNV